MSAARVDHRAEAEENLTSISSMIDGATLSAETLVAIAQVQATLALVEQQRIANLIALGQYRVGPNEYPLFRHLVLEPRGDLDVAPVAVIREALGLS